MESENPPLIIQELLQLQNLGIAANHVTWSRVTMTADTHICLRQRKSEEGNKEEILILDLSSDCCHSLTLDRLSESCMVSPVADGHTPIVAVKSGEHLSVVSLSGEPLYRSPPLPQLSFWTWLAPRTLGLVTTTAVLKWALGEESSPEEVFPRCPRLDDTEIVALRADAQFLWYALVGLEPQADSIGGLTELYCVEQQFSQCIPAHTVAFATYKFADNLHPTTVLCAATRDSAANGQGKVHVVELGPHVSGNLAPSSLAESLHFTEEETRYDFPVNVQVSEEHGLAYVVTKYGRLYVCDLETAAPLCSAVISEEVVFTAALNTASQGVLAISTAGKVISVDVKPGKILELAGTVLHKPALAERLRAVLPSPTDSEDTL